MSKKTKIAVALVLCAFGYCIFQFGQAAKLHAYADNNNCTWSATGTAYGDDRDWVCK